MTSSWFRPLPLLLLAVALAALVPACGEEEVPAPTTPTPPPPPPPPPAPEPEPEPEPDPPAVPTGLRISATGIDFIEWSWTPVLEVSGYDVQYSTNEAFTDEDEVIARTAEEISYRREGLEAETSGFVRVRSASGTGEDRITSDWSTHVPGMTMAAPQPPEPPTGLMVSETTENAITWTWNAVAGATGYIVQDSTDEVFDDTDTETFTTEASYTAGNLDPETSRFVRVAARAGTPEAPLQSAFTTHVTGTTMAPEPELPAAPSGLEVSETGDNYIEWSWNAVTGAAGYQVQHSGRRTIEDTDPSRFLEGEENTTFRVSNLDSLTSRYLRVRAYTGTLGEPLFGEWSATERGTTGAPAAPTQLDAPTDFSAGSPTNSSITLVWDEVDDADAYQVQQRPEGGDWVAASCDGGGNEVTDDTCEASGLDSGTDYEFRVRAVADGFTASAWATTSGETTGSTPTTPITSGTEDLNLRWSNSANVANQIVWDWAPVADRGERVRIEHRVALVAETDDCLALTLIDGADGDLPATGVVGAVTADWLNARSATRAMFAAAAGDTYRFCVVRTWVDDRDVRDFGEVTEVLAAASPEAPTAPAAGLEITDAAGTSTAQVQWEIDVDRGFTYQPRLVSLPGDAAAATVEDCAGGRDLSKVSGPTRRATAAEVFRAGTSAKYTRYALCYRAENEDGESAWAVGASGAQFISRPAAPALRFARATAQNVTLTWSFADAESIPPTVTAADYTVNGFATAAAVNARAAQIAQCAAAVAGELNGSRPLAQPVALANSFEVSYTHAVTQSTVGVGTTTYFYMCVQALVGGNAGPWAVQVRTVATTQLPP